MKTTQKDYSGLIILAIGAVLFIGAMVIVFKSGGQNSVISNPNDHHAGTQEESAKFNALVGQPSLPFSLQDRDGKTYSLETLRGKNVVLFFNEGLMCYPTCWNQIASFPKDSRFRDNNTEVISIVVDSPREWQGAVEQMPELAAATVVFDTGASVSSQFGVLALASSMHKGSLPGHTYVIIDKNGVIRFVFDDPNMAINNDRLIEEIKKLPS